MITINKRLRRLPLVLATGSTLFLAGCFGGSSSSGASTPPSEQPPVQPQVMVDCDQGDTITQALESVKPGDKVIVSGTCEESIWITKDILNVTLDGQGITRLIGPNAAKNPTSPFDFTFFVEGKGITIKGFDIIGGVHGIHLSGPASAVVTGNTIRKTAGAIHLDKGSIGQIHNNLIEDNTGPSINVQERSYARIGFQIPTQEQLAPNIIRNNDGYGVWVQRWSSAWVAGNQIIDNTAHGVVIDRNSQADIIANDISGNGGDGIRVSNNSGANLASDDSPRPETGNLTDVNNINIGNAITCGVDGYVRGPIGTLTGSNGNAVASAGCVVDIDGTDT